MDNREDKILFLKNVLAGKENVWALLPPKFLEFEVYESKPGINDRGRVGLFLLK